MTSTARAPAYTPTVSTHRPATRLRSIDALRGTAALAVLVSHAFLVLVAPTPWLATVQAIARRGDLGVPLFFVISGFCIHLQWALGRQRSEHYHLDFRAFWKRRLWRLYPAYWIAMSLSMLLVYVAYRRGIQVQQVQNYPTPKGPWMLGDYLAHTFMLHGVLPPFDRAGGNGPLWTLAREEYLYALYFPLLAMRRWWGLWRATLAVLVIGLAIRGVAELWLGPDSRWWMVVVTSAPVLWIQWTLGMVAAEVYAEHLTLPDWTRNVVLVIGLAVGAQLADRAEWLIAPALWGAVFFLVVNACIHREQRGAWFAGPVARWLARVGIFSYSLYLIHNPLLSVLKQGIVRVSPVTSSARYLLIVAVLTGAGYVGGRVFFWLVERHFVGGRRGRHG